MSATGGLLSGDLAEHVSGKEAVYEDAVPFLVVCFGVEAGKNADAAHSDEMTQFFGIKFTWILFRDAVMRRR